MDVRAQICTTSFEMKELAGGLRAIFTQAPPLFDPGAQGIEAGISLPRSTRVHP
jgi:hypothetical protein